MSYSAYGLDDVKKTHDAGEAGAWHCLWCWNHVRKGMSVCFSNFCICPSCVANGLKAFLTYETKGKHRRIQLEHNYDDLDEKNPAAPCYISDAKRERVVWAINKESLLLAKRVLTKKEKA